MAFEYFIQPKGPDIDVSLFGDASVQGTNVGNASPSFVTSAIQGAIKGVQQGQEIQANAQMAELRQAQIEQLPIKAEQDKLALEIARLKLENEKATQTLQLEYNKNKLTSENEALLKKREDQKVEEALYRDITSTDQATRLGVFTKPEYAEYLIERPKEAQAIVGRLNSDLDTDPVLKDSVTKQVAFTQELELRKAQQKLDAQKQLKALEELSKAEAKVREDPALSAMMDSKSTVAELINDILIDKEGAVQTRPDGTINPEAQRPEKDYTLTKDRNTLFDKGKKTNTNFTDAQANTWRKYQNLLKQQQMLLNASVGKADTGVTEGAKVSTQPPAQAATVTASQQPSTTIRQLELRGMDQLARETSMATGGTIPPEQISTYLKEGAANTGTQGVVGDFKRAMNELLPSFITDKTNVFDKSENWTQVLANPDVAKASRMVNQSANQLTDKTLTTLNNGTPQEKQALRSWAESTGVELNAPSLREYYKTSVRGALSSAYETAQTMGTRSTIDTSLRVGDTAAPNNTEQAVEEQKQVRIQTKAAQKAAEFGLSQRQSAALTAEATRVASVPALKNAPPLVQAVALVESGGGKNLVSPTGVQGIMQVTAQAERHMKNVYPTLLANKSRLTPEGSVAIGSAYIDYLRNKYNKNDELALAAYSAAGMAGVDLAVKMAGTEDWKTVKTYLLRAVKEVMRRNPDAYGAGTSPESIVAQTYNYPEKVSKSLALLS